MRSAFVRGLAVGVIASFFIAMRDLTDFGFLILQGRLDALNLISQASLLIVAYMAAAGVLVAIGGGLFGLVGGRPLLQNLHRRLTVGPLLVAAALIPAVRLFAGEGAGGAGWRLLELAAISVLVGAAVYGDPEDESASRCSPATVIAAWALGVVTIAGGAVLAEGKLPGGVFGMIAVVAVGGAVALAMQWLVSALDRALSSRWNPDVARATIAGIIAVPLLALAVNGLALRQADESGAIKQADAGDAPSIILISVDALRADEIGCLGGPARTPNIDAIAEEAFVFERAFSVAPGTRPSFAAFFSGRYPSAMGVARNHAGKSQYEWRTEPQTLTEVARQAGYATSAVVTNPNLTRAANADQGFDYFHHCSMPPPALGAPMVHDVANLFGLSLLESRSTGAYNELDDELERANVVTPRAIDVIRRLHDGPNLFWVHYMEPHAPYDPPTLPESERVVPDVQAGLAGYEGASAPERQRWITAYTAETEFNDRWIGRLVERLKQQGLWDSAIVVFWSDHGEEFWDHGGCFHSTTLYNELLHVPLMIHLPGQVEGRRVAERVSLIDVMPTVLDLAELPTPEGLTGRSLAGFLENGDALPPFEVFMEGVGIGGTRKALLTENYKLIYDPFHESFELYDLREDPHERHNLSGRVESEEIARMEQKLGDWTELSLSAMDSFLGGGAQEISPKVRQRLRDMGYIQ